VSIDGKLMKRPYGKQGQVVVARMSTPLLTCFEKFEDLPSMGRVTLRDEGRTIAIGKVIKLRRREDDESKRPDDAKGKKN
jgi:peptide chain release factor subunit 3